MVTVGGSINANLKRGVWTYPTNVSDSANGNLKVQYNVTIHGIDMSYNVDVMRMS